MEKDIEWLKGRFTGRKIFSPLNDREIGYNKAIDEFSKYVDQLDEPEILSPEWIGGNVEYAHYMTPRGTYSSAKAVIDPGKLRGILVQKQKLPVIPDYVEERIEKSKENKLELGEVLSGVFTSLNLVTNPTEDLFWIRDNQELFARAWLDGFTVEEKQKYFAKIKGHENIVSDDKYWNYCITDESLDIGDNKVHADVLAEYVLNAAKDEWENIGINDDNADFVLVGEL